MKYLAYCLFFTATLFADSITLENQTSFQKIFVEWASSARMAQESNEALMQEDAITSKLYSPRSATSSITIPNNASYFRILVWKTKGSLPELVTNWVEIVPGKKYLLKDEHLTPVLLMNGMGC